MTRSHAALLLGLAVTAGFAFPAAGIRERYNLDDFLPEGTPERVTLDRARRLFGSDDRTALFILESEHPLDLAGMSVVHDLTSRFERHIDLESVLSP